MNTFTARHGLTKIKLALAAMALACLALAFTANGAKAAQGDPFAVDFNYAALTTGLAGEAIDSLILKPVDGLGAIQARGTYTDNSGNFTLPKETGLTFPPVPIDLGGVATMDVSIALLEDGTGNYNATTGELSMDTRINLTLGVNDIQALAEGTGLPLPGEGPLTCAIDPLDLAMGTSVGWPHAGTPFANKADIEDGAVAGYWDYKPDATSVGDDSKQYLCDLIGGLLDPVGGLWLANGTLDTYTEDTVPAATQPKPIPRACEPPLEGLWPDCVGSPRIVDLKIKVAGDGRGYVMSSYYDGVAVCWSNPEDPPDCEYRYWEGDTFTLTAVAETGSTFSGWTGACSGVATSCEVRMDEARSVTASFSREAAPPPPPPPPPAAARVGKITAARKGKLKRGKTATIKVKVKNTGGKTLKGKLKIKSSNRQVKAPRSARLNVRPGKTQTIKVKVKASKKARGKAKITFSAGGKKAVTKLTVKK